MDFELIVLTFLLLFLRQVSGSQAHTIFYNIRDKSGPFAYRTMSIRHDYKNIQIKKKKNFNLPQQACTHRTPCNAYYY